MLCSAESLVARDNLYVYQGRTAANRFAREAIDAFHRDYNLTEGFHSLLDRKWDHMLDQAHINYLNPPLEPARDSLLDIAFVNPMIPTRPGIPIPELLDAHDVYVRVSIENSHGAWPGDSVFNCAEGERCKGPTLMMMDPYGAQSRWIDIATGGPRDVTFTAKPQESWIKVSADHGKILRDSSTDMRLHVSIDWDKVPGESATGTIDFRASDYSNVTITVPVKKGTPPPEDFHGFIEGDGYVVMEAGHFGRNVSSQGYDWLEMDWYGRTRSGIEMFPTTTQNFTAGHGPALEYDYWTHGDSMYANGTAEITVQIGPALNFITGKQLAFGVAFDDGAAFPVFPIPTHMLGMYNDGHRSIAIGAVPIDWINIVKAEIRNVTMVVNDPSYMQPGRHTLKLFGMTTGIVLERIWIDLGGINDRGYSYFGPPESLHV